MHILDQSSYYSFESRLVHFAHHSFVAYYFFYACPLISVGDSDEEALDIRSSILPTFVSSPYSTLCQNPIAIFVVILGEVLLTSAFTRVHVVYENVYQNFGFLKKQLILDTFFKS